jgi:ubiquinone/menaquinone biosynthesis C-methylase UbiE
VIRHLSVIALVTISTLLGVQTHYVETTKENDKIENIEKYSRFGIQGTSWLAFRDVPELVQKYVKGKRTLDYGCGNGRSTRFLKSLGLNPVGMDISINMLMQAKNLDPTGHYFVVNSGKIPAVDQFYDFVFSSFVLLVIETKEEIFQILQEAHRILKDDGTFMVITGSEELHSKQMDWLSYETNFPENDSLTSGSLAKIGNKDVGAVFYDYNWTDQDYQELFKAAGFEVIEKHNPLGKPEDGYKWKSEVQYSPHVIYVLKKTGNQT